MRLARELTTRIRALTGMIDELDQELERRTAETAPVLLDLPGCGAVTAAKLLAEIGPIERFKNDGQLARHSGVAPLEASSGRIQRHRLDRGGNRQLNAALYRIAITQARYHPQARGYLERKRAEGKSRREAIRCLKRLLVRVVFNTLKKASSCSPPTSSSKHCTASSAASTRRQAGSGSGSRSSASCSCPSSDEQRNDSATNSTPPPPQAKAPRTSSAPTSRSQFSSASGWRFCSSACSATSKSDNSRPSNLRSGGFIVLSPLSRSVQDGSTELTVDSTRLSAANRSPQRTDLDGNDLGAFVV